MIFSVLCCRLPQIVVPTTAAAATPPVVLTNCRRSIPFRLAMGLSLDRSQREPLDEAIDEEVVNDGQRNAREQRRGHESPQWYTSPRTNAIGTPRLTVILSTELMKVNAYTNSCITSVKLKTTTVKIPGTMRRGTTFTITASRL